jgi:pimeloyl-ACP methyl ester carboxylesterase
VDPRSVRPRETQGGPLRIPLLLAEAPRAVFESLTLRPARPLLRRAPRGDGHPVLVLPGFMAGDDSTRAIRRTLRGLGYRAHPWLLGRNLGVQDRLWGQLAERVEGLHQRYGRRLSLVGWSLGGVYAREIAKQLPARVRQVVTLGSPFGTTAWATKTPPDQPSTSVFSKTDGIVHWRSCLEPETDHTENIEVPGSHCGLGFNALALYAMADRLAQREGSWRPFDRSGWRRVVYG